MFIICLIGEIRHIATLKLLGHSSIAENSQGPLFYRLGREAMSVFWLFDEPR